MEQEGPEVAGVPRAEEQNPLTLNLPEPPDYLCHRIDEKIVVDGRLDETGEGTGRSRSTERSRCTCRTAGRG